MPVQDDVRERELLQLFNLHVPVERRRADTDASLRIDGHELEFELKSTTGRSVSTVRDFGADHIAKWKDKHWIFGFYNRDGTRLLYCHYASPADMAPWIAEKEEYVRPDIVLATEVPRLIDRSTLVKIFGDKSLYDYEDARRLMKSQWTQERYDDERDLPDGYSSERMVEILKLRCAYVISRGATLNNPHISGSYFEGWVKITEDHAAKLREKVRNYLAVTNAVATDTAT